MKGLLDYLETLPLKILDGIVGILPTLLFAAIILLVGNIVSKLVLRAMSAGLEKGRIDRTAHSFLKSLVTISLKVFILIIVLTVIGIPMTSIITVIGAAGLAIGLALQNSLSNLAGGFIILFTRPFKVGDFVESNGTCGTVSAISILYTQITTPDNQEAYIPNGLVANNKIVNLTQRGQRRVDINFSISYENDVEKAKCVIGKVIENNEYALKTPAPIIRLGQHGDSALIIHVRVWTASDNYWNLYYDLNEQVKAEFDANSIVIPYTQLDVHMIEND